MNIDNDEPGLFGGIRSNAGPFRDEPPLVKAKREAREWKARWRDLSTERHAMVRRIEELEARLDRPSFFARLAPFFEPAFVGVVVVLAVCGMAWISHGRRSAREAKAAALCERACVEVVEVSGTGRATECLCADGEGLDTVRPWESDAE